MKILVLGKGFVSDHLPYEKYENRLFIDSLNQSFEHRVLNKLKPDVIVNCIGATGRPNVDWCESNKAETYMANVTLPLMLAEQCAKHDVRFIQIGSGCIYFGDSPNKETALLAGIVKDTWNTGWEETDFANPQSYYSKTKYACDLAIGDLPNVTTLRIRMPISSKNTERNFINKIRGYKSIIDIPNSVTFMDDFVRCVDWVITENKTGIFHVANPQQLSAADVMKEYQTYVPEHEFSIISEKELDSITVAKRSNCILNTDKLTNSGFKMTPAKEALKKCMSEYIKNIGDSDYVK